MKPKFKISFVVEVGEEAPTNADHIRELTNIVQNQAFAMFDIQVSNVVVEEA